ncbi:MAG: SMP-30/gluconolactonase/LRE family protein [Acidobacteriia bacterium]|nr:SMP-30/gluconolactonase/LRE family protein [Terriglobia bacterium]
MSRRFYFIALVAAGGFAASLWGQQYNISTLAGNGTPGFTGDGGQATQAQVSWPGAIAIDPSGKVYIADGGNHVIRAVSNGTISTVAGTGKLGYTGDKGTATSATLNNPTGIALDASGNLYIADAGNNVIREVSNGTITTIAGNNTFGYSGDGDVATNASLSDPVAVAVDSSGNIYIADADNNVIRKVSGGNISTIVGGAITKGQLHQPDAIALDAAGTLYIADTLGRRILKFAATATDVTVIAGNQSIGFGGDNGPATKAALDDPMGVGVDGAGNVYIADTFNDRIRRISPDGTITTIAGTGAYPSYFGDGGPALNASLFFPHSVAADKAGNIYIGDTLNNAVRVLTPVAAGGASNGVVNSASYAPQVSPGSLASVFGVNLAGSEMTAAAPLPRSLAGVAVTVNGREAPILAVTRTQVNFQVPWETELGTATVAVTVNGLTSGTLAVPVLAASPGIFSDASGRAAVQNSDYTANSPSNAAQAGGRIIAYLTGCGPVNASIADGAAAAYSPLAEAMSQSNATIGGVPAQVEFTGLAPGFVGLVQMNIVVPQGLASGDYPLVVSIHGQSSNSGIISVTR